MEKQYVLTIDQGTSGTKAVLFNREGELVGRFNAGHSQFYPNPGWVEQDAEEIYQRTVEAVTGVLKETGISSRSIAVIGITNQRETSVVWDKNTGKPVYNAVVWQCQRGSDICKRIQDYGEMVRERTGLVLSPYFSAAKVAWILENVEEAQKKAEAGDLLFGTIDSWLLWKLTGGSIHATDYSNASRTQLFNIKTLTWDVELCQVFGIPEKMLPQVRCSDEVYGYTDIEGLLDVKVPIAGLMGDSHAALFGQNCFEKGMAKATYGTGSSIMMNIGGAPVESKGGLVTSLGWGMKNGIEYVLEGNINCTGATIKWLMDDLELISSSKESERIAASLPDNGGVYIVPAFVGLSAPYWDSEARAIITGISRGTKKAHFVRAAEESIAYQIKDIIDLMIEESGISLKELRVDGGPTRDSFVMQFQADMLAVPVVRNKLEELSAMGATFMAGLAVGFWSSLEEIEKLRNVDTVFTCKMETHTRETLYSGWKNAVAKALTK